MLDYGLIVVAGVAVFSQAMLGLLVTTRPPSEARRIYYEWAFGIIGAVGVIAVIWGGIRTAQTQSHIDAGIGTIQHGQGELPDRVMGLMAKLMGVPSKNGQYPDTVLGAVSSKIEDLQKRQMVPPIIIPGGTTYEIPAISAVIDVQTLHSKKTVLVLPKSPYVGERLEIKASGDRNEWGAPGSQQVEVRGAGHSIDGWPNYYLPFPNQAITIIFDGKRWNMF